jgi:sugar/nucleoside kinase (ribokinase family)
MNKGILFAGNLIIDYIKIIDKYPATGMLSNIYSSRRCIGGCAANTSVDISKIDSSVPVKVIGMIGDDENGEYILSVLRNNNIDVKGIIKSNLLPTSFTDVMTVKNTGERTFFHARGANAGLAYKHIGFKKISADIFHIGYALLLDSLDAEDSEYGTVMAKTLAEAKKNGLKTSIDVVSENSKRFVRIVTPSLKYCDYLIINEVEASRISGIPARGGSGKIINDNIKRICSGMFDRGVKEITAIHSPEAGWYMDRSGKFLKVASLNLPDNFIKGTVGAGDAFCAGMLYSIFKGFDPEYSLKIASASAAASLSHENSIDGMRPIEELLKLEKIIWQIKNYLIRKPGTYRLQSPAGNTEAGLSWRPKENKDRVSNFCNDAIGDICGIVSNTISSILSFQN